MKILVSLIVTTLISTVTWSQEIDYFTIEQYKKKYPKQANIMKDFSSIVRSVPIKTNVKKKIKITFIYPGKQISDYWRRSLISFKKRMDELNINYEVKEHFSKNNEIRKQTKTILKALKNSPDYLVFTLDAKKHEKIISQIMNERKTKVILQNITTPKKAWLNRQPFLYVGFDHLEGTKLLADYYIKETNNKGSFSVLYFTKGYVNQMRGKQFVKYMKKHSNLKLNDTYFTYGNYKKSKAATDDIRKSKSNNNFIYACSTDIALGALKSYQGIKNRPMINGWGGGSNELESIAKGEMDVTVMRMNDDNGVAMAEALKLDIEGRSSEVPTIYSGDFKLVKKGISQKDLQKLKKRAFRYSGIK